MEEFRIENNNIIFTICEYNEMDYSRLKKHIHPFYEILYLVDGEVDYIIEDKEFHVKKGNLLIIDSAKFHYVKNITKPPYKRICFEFLSEFVDEEQLIKKIFNKTPFFLLPENSPIPELLGSIEPMTKTLPPELHDSLCKSVLNLILLALFNLNATTTTTKKNLSRACSAILSYINENITQINSIDQVVSNFYYSKSYVSHIFKQEMQVGIMQYIRHKKIILADKLLKLGNRPTEVAKECGYENYISFYRSYSAFFGKPPSSTKTKKAAKKRKPRAITKV